MISVMGQFKMERSENVSSNILVILLISTLHFYDIAFFYKYFVPNGIKDCARVARNI